MLTQFSCAVLVDLFRGDPLVLTFVGEMGVYHTSLLSYDVNGHVHSIEQ